GQDPAVRAADVGMTDEAAEDLFRLLAIARYEDRYVIPPAHAEDAGRLLAQHDLSGCSLESEGGPGMGGDGPEREAVPRFHLLREDKDDAAVAGRDNRGRLHLRVAESPVPGPLGVAGAGGIA
ncbi:MAG: hypothetical protein M0010_16720, partial [Actinomycetota bacterium]|nr:hypothetical protein [Actinomycetota bacterium]